MRQEEQDQGKSAQEDKTNGEEEKRECSRGGRRGGMGVARAEPLRGNHNWFESFVVQGSAGCKKKKGRTARPSTAGRRVT